MIDDYTPPSEDEFLELLSQIPPAELPEVFRELLAIAEPEIPSTRLQ